ncbi:MAG: tRNA pseudouridine synthase A [Promethearchaeota archaeon]|nr:MAG: tRNA pseudouridine synthase A [Candidatus Lokiarchaeota archaeon]
MARWFFKYYYLGKEKYYGSQRQKDLLTVENVLLKTLKRRKYIKNAQDSGFESASRTDKYVSARGAVFAVDCLKYPILMELNSHMPKDIGIWAYSEVPEGYSPRFSALKRYYKYILPKPLSYLREKYNFDVSIVKEACNILKGTHDFQNFSKRDSEIINTVRTMEEIKLSIINDTVIIDFISEAFLRQQIRRIAKKLIQLGKGLIEWSEFIELLNPSKFISYEPANPKGLILWDIKYNDEMLLFQKDSKSIERMKNYFFTQKMAHYLKFNLFRSLLQQDDFSNESL